MLPGSDDAASGNKREGHMPRLTKRFVDSVRAQRTDKDVTLWDDTLKGFGLRTQASGAASYIIMYRTHEGRQRKLTIGSAGTITPDEARSEARQRLAEADKGGDPAGERAAARRATTVAELCDWYVKEAALWVKPNTLHMDKSRIECHVKPLIGRLTVMNLTMADVARMQTEIAAGATRKGKRKGRGGNARGGKGAAARTVSMFATILQRAKRHGLIKENVARDVQKYPGQRRTRFLSLEEMKTLGDAMRALEKEDDNKTGIAAVHALLLTGCRRNEVLSLPWAWLDARSRCIRFGDTKTGAQIRPLGRTALDYLTSLKDKTDCPWMFPSDIGDGYFVGLPRVFVRLCKRAGFTDVTLHTLRHSFASAAAELGYSELTIAGLLGHSLSGITARYAHIPDTALLGAADRVSARIAAALDGQVDSQVVPFPGITSLGAAQVS
jgi:integrase